MTADTLRSVLDRLDDQIEVAALAGSPRQVARLERRRALRRQGGPGRLPGVSP